MQVANPTGGSPDIDKAFATQIDYRNSLGALTFLAYDICITLDDEVKFIQSRKTWHMKFLFLFIRYVPLFVQISTLCLSSPELTPQLHFTPHACFIWQVYQGVATVLLFTAVDYVLILRVYALYHSSPTIRKVVLAAFGLELAGMCVGLTLAFPTIQLDEICLVISISPTLLIYGGATLLFQTFLFGLTLVKFVRAVREGWGDSPLVYLVMRDGSWAFLLLFAIVAGEASLYGLKNHTFASVLFGWVLSVFSFSGYHVLLNLDRLSDAPRLPTSQSSTNQSAIQFTTVIIMDRGTAAPHSYELSAFNARGGPSGTGG